MVTYMQKKLFTPVQVGAITLKHRVVMPAMRRLSPMAIPVSLPSVATSSPIRTCPNGSSSVSH
jgi:hypothetical protein